MTATRRLAAILAADVAGYSLLMGADEEGTLNRLKAHRRALVDPKIQEHRGRIVKTTGDGVLVEFSSVVDAVRCAVEVQRAMLDRNADIPDDQRITFRIGINLGDVIIDGGDIYGDGVNIAARLEALAEPGGIYISRVVREQVRDKLLYPFEDMGEQSVKNIARPVRAYALSAAAVGALPAVAPPPARPRATRRRTDPRREIPRLSIVVLPFANLSNDPDQEYFADGITEDLTTDLSRISGSFVIARNTAFTYKGKSVDAKQVGRELGVRYVMEGSVRRSGDQIRVNIQLVDSETGAHLWADRFDTDRANLAKAQDAITSRLARTLNIELVRDLGRRIDLERIANPDARDLIMRGAALMYRQSTPEGLEEAQRLFERALEVDPGSPDARISVAWPLMVKLGNNWTATVQQDETRVEQLLSEALIVNPNHSEGYRLMGYLHRQQGRLAEARVELETAIALNPNNANAFHQLGLNMIGQGEPEAAISHFERAIRLNPRENAGVPYYTWGLGYAHLLLGDVNEAVDLFRQAYIANPRVWLFHLWLAGALGLRGDLERANSALTESLRHKPEINSLARLHALYPLLMDLPHRALAEKTLYLGLRRAGFPDE